MTGWANGIDLTQVAARARKGANRGLLLASEHVLKVADDHVPHEEGTLERSGTATQDESQLKAAVSYNTPYAVAQHEDLTLRHDDGRTAKFLENAFTAERGTVADLIATAVRTDLEG